MHSEHSLKDGFMSNSLIRFSQIVLLCSLPMATALIGGCSNRAIESHDQYADLVADMGGQIHAHLDFTGTEITDEDLQNLEFADTVRSISLSHTAITNRGVVELERARNLEQIDLTSTEITDEVLPLIKEQPKVWKATIIALNISREAFEELSGYLNQRHAEAGHPLPMKSFSRLPLTERETLEHLGPATEAPSEPEVRLSRYGEEIQSLDGELQLHLNFSNSVITDNDLLALPFPDSVRSISLRGTPITDHGMATLHRARNLEYLDLSNTSITNKASGALKRIPRLSDLDAGGTKMSLKTQQALRRYLVRRSSILHDGGSSIPRRAGQPAPGAPTR